MGSLLTVLASSFAGCVFTSDDTGEPGICGDTFVDSGESCDDGNLVDGDGCSATCGPEFVFTANWKFVNVGFNAAGNDVEIKQDVGCPGGQFDTAAIISQAVNPETGQPLADCSATSTSAAGKCYVDLYNCTDEMGTEYLGPGTYLQWVAITSHDGTQVYSQSPSYYKTIDGAYAPDAILFADNGGYFVLDWDLVGADSNASLTCDQVAGEDGVGVTSTLVGTSNAVDDLFTCSDYYGVSAALPEGDYQLSIALVNAQNQSLGTAPDQPAKHIGVQNQITDLGTVTIPVDGM